MDNCPDTCKGHDTKADPDKDSHVCNASDDVENQGCKVSVIDVLSHKSFSLYFNDINDNQLVLIRLKIVCIPKIQVLII